MVRVLEWNFDTQPCFIESAYGGVDLPGWAERQGGLAAIPLQTRLDMVVQIATSLAAAHAAGVIHSDIKPANILVADEAAPPLQRSTPPLHGSMLGAALGAAPQVGTAPRLRLVDFGAGGLNDIIRLDALAISLHGLHEADGPRGSGTLRYMAPEVLAGGIPTTRADIYALGIMTYQLATGDFSKSLTVGWEADIDDPLLRADIAAAAAGDPERRLDSASALAERLGSLAARRAEAVRQQAEAAQAASLARQVERARLRRPWALAAVASLLVAAVSLTVGLGVAISAGRRAAHDRDEARRRADIAQAVNSFLTEDLFGRGNPAQSGRADETLMEAAQAAEAGIGRRLAREPLVAGSIYLSLARAFDSRSAWDAARPAYDQAVDAFTRAGPAGHAEAVIAKLHEAAMETVAGEAGSMARAKAMLAAAAADVPALGKRRDEAQVWLDCGNAMLQMSGGDVHAAVAGFRAAADRADAMPAVFDESTRLGLRQRLAFAFMRLGDWKAAEPMIESLLQRRLALNGPRHPATLRLELNLAQVQIAQGRADAALPVLNRIYPDFVTVFGATHLQTLTLLSTRGVAYAQLERYSDALADQMTIYHMAVAKQGAQSASALGTLSDAGETSCRAGNLAQGEAYSRTAYEGTLAAFGPSSTLAQITAVGVGFCMILEGKGADAQAFLDHVNTDAAAQLTMDPAYGVELDVMRAAVLIQAGDRAAAAPLLARAAPILDGGSTDRYMRRWVHALMAAAGK
jgi:predicted negative regulator of RcsB-dependent stress response